MSTVPRQSAFAKRRKLNDGTSTVNKDSHSPIPSQPVKSVEAKQNGRQLKSTASTGERSETGGIKKSSNEETTQSADENSFQPLVEAHTVKFNGIREIEEIDGHAYKIRLSNGQICSVYGSAKLWIRAGSICVYGALLHESPKAWPLFAPSPRSPATIEAQTKIAEFQLESFQDGNKFLPSPANMPGLANTPDTTNARSFEVAGIVGTATFVDDPCNELSLLRQVEQLRQKRNASYSGTGETPLRTLVCGKRPFETAAACIFLLNQHILAQSAINNPSPGVAVVDMEAELPVFTCPGAFSSVMIRKYVLGSGTTHPIHISDHPDHHLLQSVYVGAGENARNFETLISVLRKLLLASRDCQTLPFIIRVGPWFGEVSPHGLRVLQMMLSVDSVVCVDKSKSSRQYNAASTISQASNIPLIHAPNATGNGASSVSYHKIGLQSHFRFYDYLGGNPLWHHHAIPGGTGRELELALNRSTGIGFLLIDGIWLRDEDKFDALEGALVVIVAMENDSKDQSSDQEVLRIRDLEDNLNFAPCGLAFVETIDQRERTVGLNTALKFCEVQKLLAHGFELGLAIQKPSENGAFGRHLLFS